jgi:hypothetical protein
VRLTKCEARSIATSKPRAMPAGSRVLPTLPYLDAIRGFTTQTPTIGTVTGGAGGIVWVRWDGAANDVPMKRRDVIGEMA